MTGFDGFILLAPEWILLIGACVTLVIGVWNAGRAANIVSPFAMVVVGAALGCSLWIGTPLDGHVAPGLYLTSLTFYARAVTLTIGILIILVNWRQSVLSERGEYMALILFSLLGVLLTAAANDLLVLFFALELVSVPTYVLIALSRLDGRASEASVKYFFLGALAAAVLAYGFTFLYGAAGTTILRSLQPGSPSVASMLSDQPWNATASLGVLLVFAGFCFKIAAVPFHVYVPDVYEGAASPITGMLGFVPKIAGFIALIHLFSAMNWRLPSTIFWLVWIVAVATMTVGNLLALLQKSAKRVLAYSSIAHSGYMLIALLVGPMLGVGPLGDGAAALLFYVTVYGAMNLGAFAALASIRIGDRDAETLDDLAGLSVRSPLIALSLTVCTFSLMGMPPLAGFLSKLYVFGAAFALPAEHEFHGPLMALAIIGVVNTAIGAAYYLRIAGTLYLRSPVEETFDVPGAAPRWGLALCAIPLVLIFVWPAVLNHPAQRATMVLRENRINDASSTTSMTKPTREGATTARTSAVKP